MVMTGFGGTARVLEDIDDERRRQDEKWGEQNHDLTVWASVLGEEFGETCHAILHHRAASGGSENVEGDTDPSGWLEKVRSEAIQTAAVAVALVEYIDRLRATDQTAAVAVAVWEYIDRLRATEGGK